MKKITVSFISIMLIMSLILTGCVKKPDQTLVAQKNNERLEETAKEEPKEGTSLKEVAATTTSIYDFNYESEDGKVTIVADNVPVTIPLKDTIPMYHVNSGEIPQDVVDKIYDYFFPDGAYVITGTDITKDELDARILEEQQYIAQIRDDDELSEEEKREAIQLREELIASHEKMKESAPEESTLSREPKDSSYVEEDWESVNGPVKVNGLNVSSKDNKRWLSVVSSDKYSPIPTRLKYMGDGEYEYSGQSGISAALCTEQEKQVIGISEEDAVSMVNDFVDKIGMSWEIHDTLCISGYPVIGNDADSGIIPSDHYTGYQFVLSQSIDGIQSAVTSSAYVSDMDEVSLTWLYEQISIIVEPDGIKEIRWEYPLTVEDTVSDNVGIISFDEAKDIFENMIPLTTKGDLEQWNDDMLETTANVTVSDVRLCLMRVRNSGSDRTGLMTPVWVFYGDYTCNFHYLPGNPELEYGAQDHSNSEIQPWILLAVNAVDGSVIDITEGY